MWLIGTLDQIVYVSSNAGAVRRTAQERYYLDSFSRKILVSSSVSGRIESVRGDR